MNVLGIETSCDETAAAVVRDGRAVLSSAVHTQVALHRPYGGVVPEIASRAHVEVLPDVISAAMTQAGLDYGDLDAIAVTYGPGLASSLLVGLSAAKALSIRLAKPLVGINHLEGHIYSPFLTPANPAVTDACPLLALVVSGGHTCLASVAALGKYEVIGQTIDDAAGEAFDKGANLLGLGYPGGPAIDKAARSGNPSYVKFPIGRQRKEHERIGGMDPDFCFSYSGLKTALLYYLKDHPLAAGDDRRLSDIAASYQEAVVEQLISRCERVLDTNRFRCMVAGGGVILNSRLRTRLAEITVSRNVRLLAAEPKYCADNAAMIAGLAGAGQGVTGPHAMELDISPSLEIGATE